MNPIQETEVTGGDDDGDVSAVLPILGRGIPHVRRATGGVIFSADESGQQAETAESVASEISASPYGPPPPPPSSSSPSTSESDSSSSSSNGAPSTDDGSDIPTAARTARRQLGAHIPGPHNSSETREGRTRAQQRALGQPHAAGLFSNLGSLEGSRVVRALIAEQETSRTSSKLPSCPVQDAEPEPTSYSAACASQHSAVWGEAMVAEFEGLQELILSLFLVVDQRSVT